MSVRNTLFRTFIRQNKYINFAPTVVRGSHYERSDKRFEDEGMFFKKYRKIGTITLFSSALVGAGISEALDSKSKKKLQSKETSTPMQKVESVQFEARQKRPDLPTYTAEEVSKHDDKSSFWVTYKYGVYDVTSFLVSHPGGEQILNAAGLSIEPFWNVYGMHKTTEIYKLLETFRIGNLHDDDVVEHAEDELWVKEPVRDKRLIVKTKKPFNAEIPPQYQIQHFDTPNSLFYVRQHMPVPELKADTHTLTVLIVSDQNKDVATATKFTLQDLDKFERTTVRAALMCAGNRRSEMDKVKPVKGISWQRGAISSALWGGVLLRDVLLRCGVDPARTQGKHVIFQGSDIDATGVNFSTSIPLHMAMNPVASVMLVTHMNGEELPPDHGYPLRGVVPGAPAVRSVKWLEKIIVSEDESPSHWHQKDYRGFNPSKTWETADFSTAPPVYSLPVTSAVCDPADGDTVAVRDGCIELRGYAYSGGGAKILRVDVSADRGATWLEARVDRADPAPPQQHYAWTLWRCIVPVHTTQEQVELWVKATDSNFNTQPESFEHIWNIRGILSNAYHKITVKLDHGPVRRPAASRG